MTTLPLAVWQQCLTLLAGLHSNIAENTSVWCSCTKLQTVLYVPTCKRAIYQPHSSWQSYQGSTQFQVPNHPVFNLRLQELLLPTDNPLLEPSTKWSCEQWYCGQLQGKLVVVTWPLYIGVISQLGSLPIIHPDPDPDPDPDFKIRCWCRDIECR